MNQQLIETMKKMCCDLGISKPTIKTTRRRYGCYYPTKQIINLGQINLTDETMLKQVFVHELAHHVDHRMNVADWQDRRFSGRKSHDRKFYNVLLAVVDVFYDGDRSAYPWKWEYKTIGAWARYAGYSTQQKVSKREDLALIDMAKAAGFAIIDRPLAAERGAA